MWKHIEIFLSAIALAHGYDRSKLGLVVTQQSGGPTARHNGSSVPNVTKRVEIFTESDCSGIPPAWYDSIKTDHLDIRVIEKQGTGAVQIPRVLYAYQHHVFPGNCRMCINRWVRVEDTNAWDLALRRAGLAFRAALARHHARCQVLVISTGASFKGAEVMEDFKEVYSGNGRSMYVLDLPVYTGG